MTRSAPGRPVLPITESGYENYWRRLSTNVEVPDVAKRLQRVALPGCAERHVERAGAAIPCTL
jgi:hypothetical protein